VTTLAGSGSNWIDVDGEGTSASFSAISGVAVDGGGNVVVSVNGSDSGASNLRKITPSGKVTTLAGSFNNSGYRDGPGTTALFGEEGRVAVDANGNVYVTDAGENNRIRKITISQ
jgi:hypothetical protein